MSMSLAALLTMLITAPTDRPVMVCLGDSITDGNTYPLLAMQALHEAGRVAPAMICAGVGGDTAAQMLARLERDVLTFNPAIVSVHAGANDVMRGISVEDYQQSLRQIVRLLTNRGIRVILLTPCAVRARKGRTEAEQQQFAERVRTTLDGYEAGQRRIAAEFGSVLGEVHSAMRQALAAGQTLFVADGLHPDYRGQRIIARALLDALGCADVPLPAEFGPPLYPGVQPAWRFRAMPLDPRGKPVRLAAANVAGFVPDDAWVTYTLPEALDPALPATDWLNQCRQTGFAMALADRVGKGLLLAALTLEEPAPRTVYLQIGGGVQSVWHNGVRVHDQGNQWTGFHAGKERVAVTLSPGANQLLAEVQGAGFFLGITERRVWEAELFAKKDGR